MNRFGLTSLCTVGTLLFAHVASATKGGELYTDEAYGYGRFEARMRLTAGDGVVSAFFLWKDGSEEPGTFWNELDYEKINANCILQTNALYGNPSENHTTRPSVNADLCGDFHLYSMEWTADYIAWFLDGTEIRRETGATAAAFADNVSDGMQIHFNLWPGDSSFGGNFSPSILPVHQYLDWVQYSEYANGAFTLSWREDFGGATLPSGWLTGDWVSPKNLSTHDPANVNFLGGYAVLSLTADDATGPAGAMSGPDVATGGMGGAAGTSGSGGAAGTEGGTSPGGTSGGGVAEPGGSGGVAEPGGSGGASALGGAGAGTPGGGASGTGATTGGASAGAVSATGGSTPVGGGSSGSSSTSGGTQTASGGASGNTSSSGGSTVGGQAGVPTGGGTQTKDEGGCTLRAPGSTGSSERDSGVGAVLLLALAGALRQRRWSRAGRSRS